MNTKRFWVVLAILLTLPLVQIVGLRAWFRGVWDGAYLWQNYLSWSIFMWPVAALSVFRRVQRMDVLSTLLGLNVLNVTIHLLTYLSPSDDDSLRMGLLQWMASPVVIGLCMAAGYLWRYFYSQSAAKS